MENASFMCKSSMLSRCGAGNLQEWNLETSKGGGGVLHGQKGRRVRKKHLLTAPYGLGVNISAF